MCEIVLKEINESDIEVLRNVRNECKEFMTRNTSFIEAEQQKKWYENLNKIKNKVYLLNLIHHGVIGEVIGYGYIKIEDDYVLLSGGLIKEKRGSGYGKKLFKYLLENSLKFNLPIRLEVLKSNAVAISIYEKIGFKKSDENEKIIKMEYKYDSAI